MEVFYADIPEEGLHLEGTLPPAIFDLAADDAIRPAGDISYSADLYAFDEVVALSGHLHGPFQLQCVACLEYFDYDAEFADWSSEIDREPDQESFDLAEIIREDFLLNLPTHPRCDEFVEDRICPRADLIEEFVDDAPRVDGDEAGSDAWSVLDDWK